MIKQKTKTNSIEKVTFFGGLLILIALTGYLFYQLVDQNKSPPQLQITSRYEPSLSNYTFEVQVENTGRETAEGAQIKFALFIISNVVLTNFGLKEIEKQSIKAGISNNKVAENNLKRCAKVVFATHKTFYSSRCIK